MNQIYRNITVLNLLFIAALFVFVSYYIHGTQQSVVMALESQAVATESELLTLLQTEASLVAIEHLNSALRDCSDRSQYYELLSNLNSLNASELAVAQQLHAQCGDFRPAARSVKALVINDKVALLRHTIETLSEYEIDSPSTFHLSDWEAVSVHEQKISAYLSQLDVLQGSIISALVNNETAVVNELVGEAQEVSELLELEGIMLKMAQQKLQDV